MTEFAPKDTWDLVVGLFFWLVMLAWAGSAILVNLVLNRFWPLERRRQLSWSKRIGGRLMIGFMSPMVTLGIWKIEQTEDGWRMGDGTPDEDTDEVWHW